MKNGFGAMLAFEVKGGIEAGMSKAPHLYNDDDDIPPSVSLFCALHSPNSCLIINSLYLTGRRLVEGVKLITLAVSLGGVESLMEHAATMTHTSEYLKHQNMLRALYNHISIIHSCSLFILVVSKEDREKGGVTDGLIRFSVGLESVKDLIKDLENALNTI